MLIEFPNSLEAKEIKLKFKLNLELSRQVFFGNYEINPENKIGGIIPKIK